MEVGNNEDTQHLQIEPLAPCDPNDSSKPAPFDFITENEYITERVTSREGKRNKRMMCDCQFDPEIDDPADACGENCLNRLLMIECGSRCSCGEYCNNRRFQRALYKSVEFFKTEMKGWGLRTKEDIKKDAFVMEYCGEICTPEEFECRRKDYEKDKRRHYYFMSLKTDEIIDATRKGNLSRFINHSCDPNCETQKWTVSGKLRVGFFALRNIEMGEELTFDYQFQRFGEAAQLCYCGSDNCRGYLGVTKDPPKEMSSISGDSKYKRSKSNRIDADSNFERELYDIVGGSWRLRQDHQVLSLSRLMLRADSMKQRTMILKVLQVTSDVSCLKRFLSLHGLRLIWSWMVELSDQTSLEAWEAKRDILQTLNQMPIPNKNLVKDSKVLQVVEKWSEIQATPPDNKKEPSVVISEADCSGDIRTDTRGDKDSREREMGCEEDIMGSRECKGPDGGQSLHDQIHGDSLQVSETAEEISSGKGLLVEDLAVSQGDIVPKHSPVRETEEHDTAAVELTSNLMDCHDNRNDCCERKEELVGTSVDNEDEQLTSTPCKDTVEGTEKHSAIIQNAELEEQRGGDKDNKDMAKMEQNKVSDEGMETEDHGMGVVISDKLTQWECNVEENELVGVSCEAEAREADRVESTEGCPGNATGSLLDEVVRLASSLSMKWKELEEVFRIPKKVAPPKPPAVQENNSSANKTELEKKRLKSTEGEETGSSKRFKREGSRWDTPRDPMVQRVRDSPKSYRWSPAPPPVYQPLIPASNVPLNTRPELLGAPNVPPIHNSTVTIVQQPAGQSVYVQQQIFTPTQYVPPVTMTTTIDPYLLSQPSLPSLQPLPVTQTASPLFPFLSTSSSTTANASTASSTTTLPTQDYSQPGVSSCLQLVPLPPPPPMQPGPPNELPPNWKEATDSSGKIYYYHVITRKTQWERPGSVDEGDIMMDLESTDSSSVEGESQSPDSDHSPIGHPRTPDESPPPSPQLLNQSLSIGSSPSVSGTDTCTIAVVPQERGKHSRRRGKPSTPKDKFRHSLSKLIVRCLDHHRKPDCKYGRITCADDFKHLARKLTFGLTEKEISRKGVSSELVFTDSVKSRVKDYIKNYMKKFGPVYKRPTR